MNPRSRSLQRHMSATDDIASPLFGGPYNPQDKAQKVNESRGGTARERLHSLGNELKTERFEALKTLYLKYKQPFSAAETDGICQETPTVLNVQADLVQTINHTGERGEGRDAERLRVLSSRARSSLRPQSNITDQSRSDPRNRVIQDINLFQAVSQFPTSKVSLAPPSAAIFPRADGEVGGRFAHLSRYQPVASIEIDLLE